MHYPILVLLFIILIIPSKDALSQDKPQSTHKMKKRTKELKKKKKEQEKETVDVSEELREQHRKNQSKATKKRMKRNKKRAKRINQNKRELFLGRWWRKTTLWFKTIFRKKN